MIKIGHNISKFSTYSYKPKNKEELKEIINERIDREGNNCNLNDIDTSLIESMSYLFRGTLFNGDISNWKIPDNCHTAYMFLNCKIKEEHKPKSLQQK